MSSWNQPARQQSDDLEREITHRLQVERDGQCAVKACGAIGVPLVFVRWDPVAKKITDGPGEDKKVCHRCAERLAGLRP